MQRPVQSVLTLASIGLLTLGPIGVSAVTQPGGGTSAGAANANRSFSTSTNASNANASTNVNRGLEEAKLRVCENRQAAINRILERTARRAERHLQVFSDIAERVEAFYVRKGYTVPNYAELVDDVNAKVAAAQAQVDSLNVRTDFDCGSADPHSFLNAFRQQNSDAIDALKALQQSVRNLIVGVKSAVGQENRNGTTNASNANGNVNA